MLLLGASGSGKSTLLHGMAGLLEPTGDAEGSLRVDPGSGAADPGTRPAPGEVGLLFQDPDAQVVMGRVFDDVAFGPENRAVRAELIPGMVAEALAAVGLDVALDRSTAALSRGERQRLALAGVLAGRPGLLLLDEPTALLDPDGAAQVRDSVERVARTTGVTLVVVEHQVATWAPLVDRVVVLAAEQGVVADGPPARVLADASLAEHGVWVPHAIRPVPRRARGAPTDPVLTATGVGYRYRGSARPVLGGVDAALRPGTATAVTGPNGSGKSTLALALGGLVAPTAGRVAASPALARGLRPEPVHWDAASLAARIGSVFQDPEHQFLTGCVTDELALGPRAAGLPEPEAVRLVDRLLQRLHLDGLARANPYTLSGGEQRRLSVGTVLALSPPVLILDEPTYGQDPRTWQELVTLLTELRDDGRALCLVTHDLLFAEVLDADRVVLDAGQVVR